MVQLICGPARRGRVLGSLGQAVILGVDTTDGVRVVSLLARKAAGVPNGVRVAGTSGFAPLPADAVVLIGAGEVRVGGLRVRAVRTWATRVRRIHPGRAALEVTEQALRAAVLGVPEEAVADLTAAVRSDPQGAATARAVEALVGLGMGLTPGGDDVIAGLLTGWHATGRPELARRLGQTVLSGITGRTTDLSADLLRLAAKGDAGLEVLAALRALHDPAGTLPGDRMRPALHRLLSVGHTSGADLATGLLLGLRTG